MIQNATVTAITPPGAPDQWGKATYAAATAISVRGCLDEVTNGQRIALAATIANATAVLYLAKSSLPSGTAEPDRGHRVKVLLDGTATVQTFVVEHAANREKAGGLSHWQLFLRKA